MDADERARWNVPEPLYQGDKLVDLHDGDGTSWVRDPLRGYWPDCCDKHRPPEKRVAAPSAVPAPFRDAFEASDTGPRASEAPGPVITPRGASDAGVRGLIAFLRSLLPPDDAE